MKRILMLDPVICGSGDFTENKIYNIEKDMWNAYEEKDSFSVPYVYSEGITIKFPDGEREIYIIDNSNSEDSFRLNDKESRFIIFENDKELAHKLIDMIDGLDSSIVNMALALNSRE